MTDLTFTGERFVPGCVGDIAYEHWHRYAFARRFARLHGEVAARDAEIAYRHSLRWWLWLPWLRVRLWLEKSR